MTDHKKIDNKRLTAQLQKWIPVKLVPMLV